MNDLQNLHQNILMYDRQRAQFTGIEEVESFMDTEIVALSVLGELTIWGESMKIRRFNTDNGELEVEGEIGGLAYGTREANEKRGIWKHLFH